MLKLQDNQFNTLVNTVQTLVISAKATEKSVSELQKSVGGIEKTVGALEKSVGVLQHDMKVMQVTVTDLAKKMKEGFVGVARRFDEQDDFIIDQLNKSYKVIDKVNAKVDEVVERQDDHEKEERDHRAELIADYNKIKAKSGYLDTVADKHNIRITHLEIKAGISANPPVYATAEA